MKVAKSGTMKMEIEMGKEVEMNANNHSNLVVLHKTFCNVLKYVLPSSNILAFQSPKWTCVCTILDFQLIFVSYHWMQWTITNGSSVVIVQSVLLFVKKSARLAYVYLHQNSVMIKPFIALSHPHQHMFSQSSSLNSSLCKHLGGLAYDQCVLKCVDTLKDTFSV